MWAIPQVKSKAPINRRRHTYAEPATRESGRCFCHDRVLSQIASWYAPKQNAVACRMDLGLALVLHEHSRRTYHDSVRHSCDPLPQRNWRSRQRPMARRRLRVLTNLMRIVGVDSYDHALPLGRLLQDALALPLFGGGNLGVRRRQLNAILQRPEYDPICSVLLTRGSPGARKILQKCSSFRHEPQVFRGMQDESDLLEMLVSAVVPESPTTLGINCVRLVACVGIPTVWCGANDWVPCMPHPARNPILRPRKSDLCMIDITEADVKGVVPSFPPNDLGCCHSFLLPFVVGIC